MTEEGYAQYRIGLITCCSDITWRNTRWPSSRTYRDISKGEVGESGQDAAAESGQGEVWVSGQGEV